MQRVTLEELRVMVAKLLGYTEISVSSVGREKRRIVTGRKPGEQYLGSMVPDFPNEIGAAWQVVEAVDRASGADEMAHARATMFTTLCDEGSMWHMPGSQAATLICINYLAVHGIMVEVIEEPGGAR